MLTARLKTPLVLCAIAVSACSSVDGIAPAATDEMGDLDDEGGETGENTGEETGDGNDTDPGPDAGDPQTCDPWAQDCPVGEKCTYYDDGDGAATRCVPLTPSPKDAGEKCEVQMGAESGIDDCGAGLVCQQVDEQGFGICLELCGGTPEDPTCSDANALCQLCADDCASFCAATCDPLAPECGQDQVCTPTNEGAFVCTQGGSKQDAPGAGGDPCEYANECDVGFACVPGATVPGCNAGFCCTAYCDLGIGKSCPENQVCMPWNDDDNAPAEFMHVGVCSLP